jgi:hypothetical protein
LYFQSKNTKIQKYKKKTPTQKKYRPITNSGPTGVFARFRLMAVVTTVVTGGDGW